jgi:hypothetical protein
LHVEVAAFGEAGRPPLSAGIDDGDRVDVFVAVDIDDPAAIGRDGGRGGGPELRSDGTRGAASEFLAVDPLVGLADEVGNAAERVKSPPP